MTAPNENHLREVAQVMLDAAPAGWHKLTLRVRAVYAMILTSLRVEFPDGSVDGSHSISSEGQFIFDDLRGEMYDKHGGTWYIAEFSLDGSMRIQANFDYESKPFEDPAADDLYEDDHVTYPRSTENLSTWHPCKSL